MSERPSGPDRPRGGPPPALGKRGQLGAVAAPAQRAVQFRRSARRLLGRLAPHRGALILVIGCAVVSAALTLSGPPLLGRATDIVFAGAVGRHLPAGASKAEAVAELRREGRSRVADMVEHMDVVPGRGIDSAALGRVLALVLALYILASLFTWLQGYILNLVVQRAV